MCLIELNVEYTIHARRQNSNNNRGLCHSSQSELHISISPGQIKAGGI